MPRMAATQLDSTPVKPDIICYYQIMNISANNKLKCSFLPAILIHRIFEHAFFLKYTTKLMHGENETDTVTNEISIICWT